MAPPGKPILKPKCPAKKRLMHPKRIISEKEKDDVKRFSFARRDPGNFALQNRGLIFAGIRRHNLDLIKGVDRDDIEQECLISLIKSARRWFPPKGEYSTFAVASMADCKRILEQTNSAMYFPDSERNKVFFFRTWKRYNPSAAIEEFAEYMGISLRQAREIEWNSLLYKNSRCPKNGSALLYGEKPVSEREGGSNSVPYIPISSMRMKREQYPNPLSSLEKLSSRKAVYEAISSLEVRERFALEEAFGLNGSNQKNISEIALELGISKGKTISVLALATRKLKSELERRGFGKELFGQD